MRSRGNMNILMGATKITDRFSASKLFSYLITITVIHLFVAMQRVDFYNKFQFR